MTAVPQDFGNILQPAVGDSAGIHPRGKHRTDRAPQLFLWILRKRSLQFLFNLGFVERDDALPVGGSEFGVEVVAAIGFFVLENLLEHLVVEAEHNVGIHLDEAAIAVIGEARIMRVMRQRLHGLVVQTQIQDRIHHAGHGCTGSRTHRDQQEIGWVTEPPAGDAPDLGQRGVDLRCKFGRMRLAVGIIVVAGVRRNGEAGRYRQAEAAHFGQIGSLAAEQVLVGGAPLRRAVPEAVDPLGHVRPRQCDPLALAIGCCSAKGKACGAALTPTID